MEYIYSIEERKMMGGEKMASVLLRMVVGPQYGNSGTSLCGCQPFKEALIRDIKLSPISFLL